MKPREALSAEVTGWLRQVGEHLERVSPSSTTSIHETPHRGGVQVSLSFLRTPDASSLDLCVLIRQHGDDEIVEADVVEGGTGRVLSEWSSRAIGRDNSNLDSLREYVLAQAKALGGDS